MGCHEVMISWHSLHFMVYDSGIVQDLHGDELQMCLGGPVIVEWKESWEKWKIEKVEASRARLQRRLVRNDDDDVDKLGKTGSPRQWRTSKLRQIRE